MNYRILPLYPPPSFSYVLSFLIRRAKAERESRRKAMQARAKKGVSTAIPIYASHNLIMQYSC